MVGNPPTQPTMSRRQLFVFPACAPQAHFAPGGTPPLPKRNLTHIPNAGRFHLPPLGGADTEKVGRWFALSHQSRTFSSAHATFYHSGEGPVDAPSFVPRSWADLSIAHRTPPREPGSGTDGPISAVVERRIRPAGWGARRPWSNNQPYPLLPLQPFGARRAHGATPTGKSLTIAPNKCALIK